MVLGSEHRAHYRTSEPQAMKFWSRYSGGHSFGHKQCSACSTLHKGAGICPADGFRTFYSPVQLFENNHQSPEISSMFWSLRWETH